MSGNPRDDAASDGDSFLGEYACEATPHWLMFTVTRAGAAFALKAMGQLHIADLELHSGQLTGIVDGSPARLSRESDGVHYTFSGEARKTCSESRETVPVEATLVKRLPGPGSTWEEKFGVTAADLVRRVRESEQWIHQFESLHLVADIIVSRTPEGIEHHKRELEALFPGENISPQNFPDLAPSEAGREELHIDRRRFRHSNTWHHKRAESIDVWNGQTRMTYSRNDAPGRERQGIAPDLGKHGAPLLSGFAWPRAQRHKFWWMGHAPDPTEEHDQFGRAEDFILMGQQDYRGIPCYVLECRPEVGADVRRWFVGVEDGLLRGSLSYGLQLRSEFWMDRYEEIEPDCWFPMRQGYHLFEYDAGLNAFLSGRRNIIITQIAINKELPDELFQIDFKEGIQTFDHRVPGVAVYEYKKDMTEQEWEPIRAEARKRTERNSRGRVYPGDQ